MANWNTVVPAVAVTLKGVSAIPARDKELQLHEARLRLIPVIELDRTIFWSGLYFAFSDAMETVGICACKMTIVTEAEEEAMSC